MSEKQDFYTEDVRKTAGRRNREQDRMNEKETMEYIEELKQYGSVPGLDNIRNLCEKAGNPQDELKFIHIAGTNGKGSVLAFVSEILKCAGYKVGRYLSPSVMDYREKIQVNGRMITKKALAEGMTVLRGYCEELVQEGKNHPTVFEVETALAFWYFQQQKCDIVVLETGLGGELDATNIVTDTQVCVITPISMDHMGILGKTLPEIAAAKAGIMKKGAVAVSAKQSPEVFAVLKERAEALSVPLYAVEPEQISGRGSKLTGQKFAYQEFRDLTISLAGRYQLTNAALAIEAIKALRGRRGETEWAVSDEAIRKGLKEAFWPGRFQVLAKKPYVIADGAHNRDGAEQLAESLRYYFKDKRLIYIMGILRDKEQEEIIKATAPLSELILTISTKGERGFSAYELAELCRPYQMNVTAMDGLQEALEAAYLLADKESVIVVFGSLSFLGELIPLVETTASQKAGQKGSMWNV